MNYLFVYVCVSVYVRARTHSMHRIVCCSLSSRVDWGEMESGLACRTSCHMFSNCLSSSFCVVRGVLNLFLALELRYV